MGDRTNRKPWWQPGVTAMGLAVGWLPATAVQHFLMTVIKRRVRRLPADEALRFLLEVDRRLYHFTGKQSVRYGNGTHSKHRHTDYHRFFIDRIGSGQRVLDVGCGIGAVARHIADETGACVTAIDLNASNIERAKQDYAHPKVTYLHGDATRDTPDQPFHVVMLSNVLEHLHNRPDVLRSLVDRHKPERVLIRVPCFDRDWQVPLKEELGIDSRLDTDHKIEYTADSFREEMGQADLEITHLEVKWGEIWSELRPGGPLK